MLVGAMILAVVLGALIGLALGALGGGGSILAVPVLAHIAGQTAEAATATSLVAVGAASLVAGAGHARNGRVDWRAALAFVTLGVPGTWLGATLNARLDGDALLLAFSVLVLVAAQRMLTGCPSCTNVGEERALSTDRSDPLPASGSGTATALSTATEVREVGGRLIAGNVLLAASAVGVLTGLFGVGGGFVIVPALTLALRMPMPTAIGTSLVIIVGNAAVALAVRGLGAVGWSVAVPFAATMLVGSALGALVSARLPAKRSLQAFAGLLVAVALANGIAAGWALVA